MHDFKVSEASLINCNVTRIYKISQQNLQVGRPGLVLGIRGGVGVGVWWVGGGRGWG